MFFSTDGVTKKNLSFPKQSLYYFRVFMPRSYRSRHNTGNHHKSAETMHRSGQTNSLVTKTNSFVSQKGSLVKTNKRIPPGPSSNMINTKLIGINFQPYTQGCGSWFTWLGFRLEPQLSAFKRSLHCQLNHRSFNQK